MVSVSAKQIALDTWARRITRWLSRMLHGLSRHWLLLANAAIALYAGLPLLAPVLMHAGHTGAGNIFYLVFRPLCHQLPERSFFLYGPRWYYSLLDLQGRTGLNHVPLRYIGNLELGFKVSVCERCMAIYVSMLAFGLAFGLLRKRLKPLKFAYFCLMIAPMAIDGFGQLFGLWTSTWLTRVVTGGLFGCATVWLTFPYINRGMAEVHESTGAARTGV
jgi:uncharacterized membrane protein